MKTFNDFFSERRSEQIVDSAATLMAEHNIDPYVFIKDFFESEIGREEDSQKRALLNEGFGNWISAKAGELVHGIGKTAGRIQSGWQSGVEAGMQTQYSPQGKAIADEPSQAEDYPYRPEHDPNTGLTSWYHRDESVPSPMPPRRRNVQSQEGPVHNAAARRQEVADTLDGVLRILRSDQDLHGKHRSFLRALDGLRAIKDFVARNAENVQTAPPVPTRQPRIVRSKPNPGR